METPRISPTLTDGRNVVKRYCESLTHTPGVYRMLDGNGNVLYVGKAKSLKNRVSNYVNTAALNTRLQRMIAQTASMEFVTTRSEAEALLLEANLIKKFSPRYNILLKDDKSFPFILISGDHEFPRISKHRGPKTKRGKYFGPFVSARAVDETLTLLQKAFLLRPCADTIFKNRTRPCLQYQIKRCSAPCVNKIAPEQYKELVAQAQAFLSGKSRQIQEDLIEQMQQLSLQMNYEKASVIRDRLKAISQVQQQTGISSANVGDADIIALERRGADCCVQIFCFRGGRNYGTRTWFPAHTSNYSDAEVISNFIGQYYQTQPVPPLILTSHMLEEASLLEEALRMNTDYKVEIAHPLRGEKRDLIEQALRNAKEALIRHISINVTQRVVLAGVQTLFGLEEVPQRIEIYDNSHIMGTHAVGAMVVAGPEGFIKTEYRTFNIKNPDTQPGDDYAMMREVFSRRFRKLQESAQDDATTITEDDIKKPDLILIDGGLGQLSAVAKVFEDMGIQGLNFVAIAKGPDRNAGREQFFMPGKEPFQLPPDDVVLHYLQRLRDEAHRFAIGTHRNKRSKSMRTSELDAIALIGPGRKKALLNHFGSAKDVAAASIEEIQKVPGISKSTAQVIYQHFHGGEIEE